MLRKLRRVCFTGGEPLIIKEYYDYLDFLIESELSSNLEIELFTNCSVYNPLFVNRLNKFKYVELVMSIDGVGKTAEYIRHGMPWSTIERNVKLFNSLKNPFNLYFTVAISGYTLLDVANLARFYMEMYEANNNISVKCYTVLMQSLRFQNAPDHLKHRMLSQIDEAIEILSVPNYDTFRNELKNIKAELGKMEKGNTKVFCEYTEKFDKIRNESFEETFGISLYP